MDRHTLAQERSLVAHRVIAARLLEDPQIVERARERLERWSLQGNVHPHWLVAWRDALDLPAAELADRLCDPANADLRQTSPFAGELDARERWSIWRSVA